jgi:hypothetical protein
MRSILLAGAALCLAAIAPFALAEAATVDVQAVPAAAPAPAAEPLPALSQPASEPAATAACATEPLALGSWFGPYCGDYCSEPWAEDYCVGYDCSGTLRIDACFCSSQNRWHCQWQQCPGW